MQKQPQNKMTTSIHVLYIKWLKLCCRWITHKLSSYAAYWSVPVSSDPSITKHVLGGLSENSKIRVLPRIL